MGRKIKIKAAIIILTLLLPFSAYSQSHAGQWSEAKSISGNFKAVASQPEIEVFSAPNIIMLKVNHETKVRIFTILGKLVSEKELTPGIFQFQIESHGVYIIKTENTSCKVAI